MIQSVVDKPVKIEVLQTFPALDPREHLVVILPITGEGFEESEYMKILRAYLPYETVIAGFLDHPHPVEYIAVRDTIFAVVNLSVPVDTETVLSYIFDIILDRNDLHIVMPATIKNNSSLPPDFSFKASRRITMNFLKRLWSSCPLRIRFTVIGDAMDAMAYAMDLVG